MQNWIWKHGIIKLDYDLPYMQSSMSVQIWDSKQQHVLIYYIVVVVSGWYNNGIEIRNYILNKPNIR